MRKNKSKTADYHDNVNHSIFLEWFEEKICKALTIPSTFIMDNAAYHKVKILAEEETKIFDGRTFSQLSKEKNGRS